MTDRYITANESTPECEWETFIGGKFCPNKGTQVIIDTEDKTYQMDDHIGFHVAHLCDDHITKAFELIK